MVSLIIKRTLYYVYSNIINLLIMKFKQQLHFKNNYYDWFFINIYVINIYSYLFKQILLLNNKFKNLE